MIELARFLEAQRLLALGRLSQRKIAALAGVSRSTVNAIACGKYQDRLERESRRPRDVLMPSGPLVRCPGCGGRAQMPCMLCRVQKQQDAEQEFLRAARKAMRRDAARKLVQEVRRAYWQREAIEEPDVVDAPYSPPAASTGGGPSDCKYANRSRTSCGCKVSSSRSGMSDCSEG